jgi:4'-phosphopantetheinyl transferase
MTSTSHRWRIPTTPVRRSALDALSERLDVGAIHVWTISASNLDIVDECREYISPQEADEASRFLFERDYRNSVVSRGFRRMMLARHTGKDPHALRFAYGPQGKPSLADHPTVRFNVTHSGDVVMFAVTRGCEVGLDVEQMKSHRTPDDLEGIAKQAFSARERHDIARLPAVRREAAFYRCWTEKEAFIKLVGAGMQFPLDAFDVEVDPDKPPALLALRAPAPNALPCGMASLAAPPGYMAAMAVRGAPVGICTFTLS